MYDAKGKLNCFNCKAGVWLRLFTLISLQKKAITARVTGKKSTPLWGIFNIYKEQLSVPRVQTADLIEF